MKIESSREIERGKDDEEKTWKERGERDRERDRERFVREERNTNEREREKGQKVNK